MLLARLGNRLIPAEPAPRSIYWRKRFDKLDTDLDIAAGRGLEQAVVQSTQIGAVNSWLRGQPEAVAAAAIASVREALAAHQEGAHVRLPAAMWLVSSTPA